MPKKDIYKLLKISNKNSGDILTAKQALKLFGYSEKTNFNETTAHKYVKFIGHASGRGTPPLYEVREWVIITRAQTYELKVLDLYLLKRKYLTSDLFLFPKDRIPWWRLKEYGGNI